MDKAVFITIFFIFLCGADLGFSQSPQPAGLSEKTESAVPGRSAGDEDLASADSSEKTQATADSDAILTGVETRYSGTDFSARFYQTSTIKAMDITDHASGAIQIKRPGMMRWEYETPEKQLIVTDGKDLWIYRPDDKQVMVGKAPVYFGGGKGAGFLSDIRLIRNDFTVSSELSDNPDSYKLKLIPNEKKFDIAMIYLLVSKNSFDVTHIISSNSYGDETTIELSNFAFNLNPADHVFRFVIPEGADILQLDE